MTDIKESFVDLMEENQWLETSTKERALKKLNAIKETIDYNESILNDTESDNNQVKRKIYIIHSKRNSK